MWFHPTVDLLPSKQTPGSHCSVYAAERAPRRRPISKVFISSFRFMHLLKKCIKYKIQGTELDIHLREMFCVTGVQFQFPAPVCLLQENHGGRAGIQTCSQEGASPGGGRHSVCQSVNTESPPNPPGCVTPVLLTAVSSEPFLRQLVLYQCSVSHGGRPTLAAL